MKQIIFIGVIALFLLSFASIFSIRSIPHIKEMQNFSKDLKHQFDLENVLLSRIKQKNSIEYKIIITQKENLGNINFAKIGEYFFIHYVNSSEASKLTIVHEKRMGNGCYQNIEQQSQEIPLPTKVKIYPKKK